MLWISVLFLWGAVVAHPSRHLRASQAYKSRLQALAHDLSETPSSDEPTRLPTIYEEDDEVDSQIYISEKDSEELDQVPDLTNIVEFHAGLNVTQIVITSPEGITSMYNQDIPLKVSKPLELPKEDELNPAPPEPFTTTMRRDAFICTPENTIDMSSVNIFLGGPSDFQTQNYPVAEVVAEWEKVVKSDVAEWRRRANIEWQAIFRPGEPAYSDIEQGNIGDCYLLASLKAILAKPWGPRYVTQVLNFYHRKVYVPVFTNAGQTWETRTSPNLEKNEFLGRLRLYQEKRCILFPLKVITSKCGVGRCLVGANRYKPGSIPNWVNAFETAFLYYKWYLRHADVISERFSNWWSVAPDLERPRVEKLPLSLGAVGLAADEFTLPVEQLLVEKPPDNIKAMLKHLFEWYDPTEQPETLKVRDRQQRIEQIRESVASPDSGPLALGMISSGHATDVDPLFFAKAGWNIYAMPGQISRIKALNLDVTESSYFTITKISGHKTVEFRLSLYADSTAQDAPTDFIEWQFEINDSSSIVFKTGQELIDNNLMFVPVESMSTSHNDLPEAAPIKFCKSSEPDSEIAWSLTLSSNMPNCNFQDDDVSSPVGIFVLHNVDVSKDPPPKKSDPATANRDLVTNAAAKPEVVAFKIEKDDDGNYVRTDYRYLMMEYRLSIQPTDSVTQYYVPGQKVEAKGMRGVLLVNGESCPPIVQLRQEMAALSRFSSCSTFSPLLHSVHGPKSCVQTSFEIIQEAISKVGQIAIYGSSRPNKELPVCCSPLLNALLGRNGEAMCQGIAYGHAYAILDTKIIRVNSNSLMFVLLSNPWGSVGRRYQVGSGGKLTRVAATLAEQHGNFWMEMTDLLINFERVFGFSLDASTTGIMTAVAHAPRHEASMGPKTFFDPDRDSLSPIMG